MPRKLCESCGRPLNVCLCDDLVSVKAPCAVAILQHPSELKQPLATVPILKLCLKPLNVLVGEDFSEHAELQTLLAKHKNVHVLYPSEDAKEWSLQGDYLSGSKSAEVDLLLVIDGTWRKAKRIWLSNPFLHSLPCVKLTGGPAGQYQVRSTTVEGGISTLEAVAQACNYLSKSHDFDELYKPFKAMINMQIEKMGADVFRAHYENSNS
jgi:DTW domain-containing protein YfiP